MAYKIAFYDTKPYDERSFTEANEKFGFDIKFYKGHLNMNNVVLTKGADVVCIFVNDTADAEVIRAMADNGVKLLALRCAGYNNVDLTATVGRMKVVRVPAYLLRIRLSLLKKQWQILHILLYRMSKTLQKADRW